MKKRKEKTTKNGKNANKTLKKKPSKDKPIILTPEEEAMRLRYEICP